MPIHEIHMSLPSASVVNTDVEIKVFSDGVKLGELHVSKGSVDWLPARRPIEIRLSWEKFAQVMEDTEGR